MIIYGQKRHVFFFAKDHENNIIGRNVKKYSYSLLQPMPKTMRDQDDCLKN